MENIITHDYLRKVIAQRIPVVAKSDLPRLINSEPLFQERIHCGAMLLRIFDGKNVNQSEFLAQMQVICKRIENMADRVYSIRLSGSDTVFKYGAFDAAQLAIVILSVYYHYPHSWDNHLDLIYDFIRNLIKFQILF